MEEKGRFTDLHYLDSQIFVYDNKLKSKRIMSIEECFELLNQQDKQIKELEEENKVGDFWHIAYQGKQLEYDQVYAELRKAYEENQRLKEKLSKKEETHKHIMSGEYIPANIAEKSLKLSEQAQKQVSEGNIAVDSNQTIYNQLLVSDGMETNKVYIWGYELCKGSDWNAFLEVVNKLGKENKRLKEKLNNFETCMKKYNVEDIEHLDLMLFVLSGETKYHLKEIKDKHKKELKQSQKRLAIEELEKVRKSMICCSFPEPLLEISKQIKERIKELKGEE